MNCFGVIVIFQHSCPSGGDGFSINPSHNSSLEILQLSLTILPEPIMATEVSRAFVRMLWVCCDLRYNLISPKADIALGLSIVIVDQLALMAEAHISVDNGGAPFGSVFTCCYSSHRTRWDIFNIMVLFEMGDAGRTEAPRHVMWHAGDMPSGSHPSSHGAREPSSNTEAEKASANSDQGNFIHFLLRLLPTFRCDIHRCTLL